MTPFLVSNTRYKFFAYRFELDLPLNTTRDYRPSLRIHPRRISNDVFTLFCVSIGDEKTLTDIDDDNSDQF
jgi:hypothetical protein